MCATRWFWGFICAEDFRNNRWRPCNIQKSRYESDQTSVTWILLFSKHHIPCGLFADIWEWLQIASQGGYDLLGRTKDQIRTTEQVNAAMAACKALKLDGLVVVGGTSDSLFSNFLSVW